MPKLFFMAVQVGPVVKCLSAAREFTVVRFVVIELGSPRSRVIKRGKVRGLQVHIQQRVIPRCRLLWRVSLRGVAKAKTV